MTREEKQSSRRGCWLAHSLTEWRTSLNCGESDDDDDSKSWTLNWKEKNNIIENWKSSWKCGGVFVVLVVVAIIVTIARKVYSRKPSWPLKTSDCDLPNSQPIIAINNKIKDNSNLQVFLQFSRWCWHRLCVFGKKRGPWFDRQWGGCSCSMVQFGTTCGCHGLTSQTLRSFTKRSHHQSLF